MKLYAFLAVFIFTTSVCVAQDINKLIDSMDVRRIETTLSADSMLGRKTFTPSIEKAADFIEAEFKKTGLAMFPGLTSYRQSFALTRAKFISAAAQINGTAVDMQNIIAVTTAPDLDVNERSGYTVVEIDSSQNLRRAADSLIKLNRKTLVLVRSYYADKFKTLKVFKQQTFTETQPVIFLLTDVVPSSYSIQVKHEITRSSLANVVGVLPGKSRKNEYVVFSGHYDHLGTGKPDETGDSIFNGANDDAAGVTAMIMLAKYFSRLKQNERTLIFVAFTAEEIGGYGSQYFSKQLDADKTVAMFNIEMIGTQSKWGANSAYITGYERSDFGKLLQQNLGGSAFHFEPDPYPAQNLFYRSDNATLAALGVPAHTISTSQMDSDHTYHTKKDELQTLDLHNMTEIIKAIAISSRGIVSGSQTPVRIEKRK